MPDVGMEVARQGLGVAEVEPSLEVEVEDLVFHNDFAVEIFVVEVAVQRYLVDLVAETGSSG